MDINIGRLRLSVLSMWPRSNKPVWLSLKKGNEYAIARMVVANFSFLLWRSADYINDVLSKGAVK